MTGIALFVRIRMVLTFSLRLIQEWLFLLANQRSLARSSLLAVSPLHCTATDV
jgi:hypothetical protein